MTLAPSTHALSTHTPAPAAPAPSAPTTYALLSLHGPDASRRAAMAWSLWHQRRPHPARLVIVQPGDGAERWVPPHTLGALVVDSLVLPGRAKDASWWHEARVQVARLALDRGPCDDAQRARQDQAWIVLASDAVRPAGDDLPALLLSQGPRTAAVVANLRRPTHAGHGPQGTAAGNCRPHAPGAACGAYRARALAEAVDQIPPLDRSRGVQWALACVLAREGWDVRFAPTWRPTLERSPSGDDAADALAPTPPAPLAAPAHERAAWRELFDAGIVAHVRGFDAARAALGPQVARLGPGPRVALVSCGSGGARRGAGVVAQVLQQLGASIVEESQQPHARVLACLHPGALLDAWATHARTTRPNPQRDLPLLTPWIPTTHELSPPRRRGARVA